MSQLDQFESVFLAADKKRYRYTPIEVGRVLVVTDLLGDEASRFTRKVASFLVELGKEVTWETLTADRYDDVDALLEVADAFKPDLVVTYRNVRYSTWRWPHSLGVHLNVLTRETRYPVVIVPNPHEHPELGWHERETRSVMVLADTLVGDDALVDWGVRFTRPKGKLYLTHVEDDDTFARYLDVIAKLPEIDTEAAREQILGRLLKEPRDYIESCRAVLAEQPHLTLEVVPVVEMGHTIRDYTSLIEKHNVDLLAFETKSEDKLALHGAAYSLAVRLRTTPLLMI